MRKFDRDMDEGRLVICYLLLKFVDVVNNCMGVYYVVIRG